MKAIIFEAEREGYTKSQVWRPVTVVELREFLEQYEDDVPIFLSHDRGYTYGTLRLDECEEIYKEDEDEEA